MLHHTCKPTLGAVVCAFRLYQRYANRTNSTTEKFSSQQVKTELLDS